MSDELDSGHGTHVQKLIIISWGLNFYECTEVRVCVSLRTYCNLLQIFLPPKLVLILILKWLYDTQSYIYRCTLFSHTFYLKEPCKLNLTWILLSTWLFLYRSPFFPILFKIHQPSWIHGHSNFIVNQKVKSKRLKC